MPRVMILTEAELRACVALDPEAVAVVEGAFRALADGGVVMPPILSMAIKEKHGEVDVKAAYVPGLESFAIKVSPGFFDNPTRGLPSLNGLMMLFDSDTGIVKAVLLDNGFLTDVRTAAAGAVAAKHLAPRVVTTAGVIGAGVQADLQIRALRLVRDFAKLMVWARDSGKAAVYADRMQHALGLPVRVAATAEEVVREAQIVVTTTASREPIVKRDWLHPGLHITAMGSDAPEKSELDPRILKEAARFVCDRRSQSLTVGEMRLAVETGIIPADRKADELGEIVAGQKPGRRREDEVTICDLTGTGVQDTAIATHAFRVARERGLGRTIES
ncbi:MAG TPA: cyclodeaminase [Propylenella sp.]